MTPNQHIVSLWMIAVFAFQSAIIYHKSEKVERKHKVEVCPRCGTIYFCNGHIELIELEKQPTDWVIEGDELS